MPDALSAEEKEEQANLFTKRRVLGDRMCSGRGGSGGVEGSREEGRSWGVGIAEGRVGDFRVLKQKMDGAQVCDRVVPGLEVRDVLFG